jgi:tetratricopeptide (TPR) repeat protein
LALAAVGFFAWQAHESERRRQEAIAAEKREAAMEKAILAAMSGQLTNADAALLEAERLGAGLAERRFVAGVLSQYRGDTEGAKRLLLEACEVRPDQVAPRAFLAVVCNYLDDWEGEMDHGNKALALTPVTPEDHLFRSYMIGFTNPQRGLPELEEALDLRRSVLAQFVRSELLTTLADVTGRVEDAAAARDALRSVRTLMGDAPMLTVSNLYIASIGCNNCRLHGRAEEARRWLDEGAGDFRAAAAYRENRGALEARSLYLWFRDGTTASLDAETREAGRRAIDSFACQTYLGSLFRRGETQEALEYLRTVRDNGSDLLVFARVAFLVGRDVEAARAECRRALTSGVRSRFLANLCYALSLAGMPDEAQQQAKAFRENPLATTRWDAFAPAARRVTGHAYEGLPLDVEAEIAGSRWKRYIAYDTLGFAALGRGRRDQALPWFRQAAEHTPIYSVSYLWMQAIRERILADPTWPPAAAKK